ncbi:hypothetical protein, partial [Prevotella dentalis]|uniref:hypothetical protein n=1 Tax=Prevotella dentalis TaxID=52227 RepID=UPI00265B304E
VLHVQAGNTLFLTYGVTNRKNPQTLNKRQASVVASLQSAILKIFSKNMGKHLVVSEIVATFAIAYKK